LHRSCSKGGKTEKRTRKTVFQEFGRKRGEKGRPTFGMPIAEVMTKRQEN